MRAENPAPRDNAAPPLWQSNSRPAPEVGFGVVSPTLPQTYRPASRAPSNGGAAAAAPAVLSPDPLIEKVRTYNPLVDADKLRLAFTLADQAHAGQLRESGAPYIVHPLRVAEYLADLSCDLPTLCAGLLHDVVEDTSVELETIRREFGEDTARLVDGVTKLSQTELHRRQLQEADPETGPPSSEKQRERAANIRKIFLAMAQDVRVMLVKLADRLHNMQTLEGLDPAKQRRVSEETLQIFAPIAHRLGLWHFKWQLEDLSFKYLHPKEYNELSDALARTRRDREQDVAEVRQHLQASLAESDIVCEVHGRAKHLYSIWNKIQSQALPLDQIYDLVAVRVIVQSVEDCYRALGLVHSLWLPIPGLFSDHIGQPKPNGYRSLHTKVIGPRGEPMEIQIRTGEMHRTADYGVAAHWNYKEGSRPDRRFEEKLAWLRNQMSDWNSDSPSDTDFMRSVIEDMFTDQVFVFTPRGDVVDLPAGSCPLDFAFRIHSELGLRCVGARVNGQPRPLDYQFQSGDIAEIITRPSAQPSYDWLNRVKTTHARNRIRAYFRKLRHSEYVVRGRDLLEKEVLRAEGDPRALLRDDALLAVAQTLNYQCAEDLLAGVGHGHVSALTVLNRLRTQQHVRPQVSIGRPLPVGRLSVSADGMENLYIRRSRCCQPLPGEEVVGYVTRGRGIAIHREGCPNLIVARAQEPERLQPVNWHEEELQRLPTAVRIETLDRVGLMAEVTAALKEMRINIEQANIRTRPGQSAVWDFVVSLETAAQLDRVIQRLGAIPDVLSVTRPGPRSATPSVYTPNS